MEFSAVSPGNCHTPRDAIASLYKDEYQCCEDLETFAKIYNEVLDEKLSYYLSNGKKGQVYEHNREDVLEPLDDVLSDRHFDLYDRPNYEYPWGALAIGPCPRA